MTESAPQPTHRPQAGAEIVPRGYALGTHFHPPISLSKGGYNFAHAISEYLEARSVVLDPTKWTFSQPLSGSAESGLHLTIEPNLILLEAAYPAGHRMEWIENRFKMVLEVFGDMFKPKVSLDSMAKVNATMQIDGDAREFLVRHVTKLDPNRFSLLKRPIHAFGIRVFCPPYQKIEKKGKRQQKVEEVLWHVDVRAESLIEDPTVLYLDAEASWPVPGDWSGPKIREIVGHLDTVSDYLGKDVIEFLQNPTSGGTP
jgi:hypothetical protein